MNILVIIVLLGITGFCLNLFLRRMSRKFPVFTPLFIALRIMTTIFLFAVILQLASLFRVFWQFDHIEHRAKKVITGTELQTWATNLLAQYPTNATPNVSQLGTNFPPQLLTLYRNPPYIHIWEATPREPAHVYLMWGGGMIGHCGFEIGPVDFYTSRSHARAWQPGVYFWSDYPPK